MNVLDGSAGGGRVSTVEHSCSVFLAPRHTTRVRVPERTGKWWWCRWRSGTVRTDVSSASGGQIAPARLSWLEDERRKWKEEEEKEEK